MFTSLPEILLGERASRSHMCQAPHVMKRTRIGNACSNCQVMKKKVGERFFPHLQLCTNDDRSDPDMSSVGTPDPVSPVSLMVSNAPLSADRASAQRG